MSALIVILTVVHVLVALILIGLVLMQKSKEQGVGAAFMGGVTETVFGAGTTTALVRLTIYFACALLATTLLLAMLHSQRGRGGSSSLMNKALQSTPAPVPGPAAAPANPLSAKPVTPVAAPDSATPAPAPVPTPTPTPSTPAPSTPAP